MTKTFVFGKCLRTEFSPDTLAVQLAAEFGGYGTDPGFEPHILWADGSRTPLAAAPRKTARAFHSGVGPGVRVRLEGMTGPDGRPGPSLELQVMTGEATGEVLFTVSPLEEGLSPWKEIAWPGPLLVRGEEDAAGFAALPMSQGMLIPDACADDFHTFMGGQIFTREAVQPWWGVYRRSGYFALAEQPWDAAVRYDHAPGQATRVRIAWLPELGRLSYSRTLRVRPMENCGYVALAKTYRAWLKETSGLVTLEEKCLRTPKLRQMIGTPVVLTPMALVDCVPESPMYNAASPESNRTVCTFETMGDAAEALRRRGLQRAYYHIDGWGKRGYDNEHPDILPPNREAGGTAGLRRLLGRIAACGSLSALHDQYRDYYTRAASFDRDNAVLKTDGNCFSCNAWLGGEQLMLCAQLAPDYVRRNTAWLEAHGIVPDGTYLDVFSVVEPDECANPRHRMTRRQCVERRRECFEIIRRRGEIVSSEEGVSAFVDAIDLVHHAPYIYALFEMEHLNLPGLIPVPLLNLVYHDCLLEPWALGHSGWGLPAGQCGALHGLLNGGLPMLDGLDPSDEELRLAGELCRLQSTVWNREMTGHELLSADAALQRSTFADGTAVTVDWRDDSWVIEEPGRPVQRGRAAL